MVRRVEFMLKCGFLGGQKRVFGLGKLRADNQNRKAKWCKMQVVFLKNDKAKDVKDQELWSFCYFLGHFFARTK